MLRKVILFAAPSHLKALGELLEMEGVSEVVRVPVIGGSAALIAAVKKHRDVSAIIVYGGAIHLILLPTARQIRTITKAPILLVMFEKMSRGKESDLRAVGITEILARYDAIGDREVADIFREMVVNALPARPVLRLVKSDAIRDPIQESPPAYPLQGIQEALAIAGELEQRSVGLRQAAQSGAIPISLRRISPAADPKQSIAHLDLSIEPSNGQRGPNVTFYGWRFHLTNPLCEVLDLLYCNMSGVVKEQMYALGIQRNPTYVSVAIANLRRRLLDTNPYWVDVVKCINGRYVLDFDKLAKSRRKE